MADAQEGTERQTQERQTGLPAHVGEELELFGRAYAAPCHGSAMRLVVYQDKSRLREQGEVATGEYTTTTTSVVSTLQATRQV